MTLSTEPDYHANVSIDANAPEVPYGYCGCGCGRQTKIATQTNVKYGYIKGVPYEFAQGHRKIAEASDVHTLYKEEDRGYKTPCWIWQKPLNDGYGMYKIKGRTLHAHIYMYELVTGNKVPKYYGQGTRMTLDHLCRVRACVNPYHLEPVTTTENIRRGRATKLTYESVAEIRRLNSEEGVSYRILGRVFDVDSTTISAVCRFKTWKTEMPDSDTETERKEDMAKIGSNVVDKHIAFSQLRTMSAKDFEELLTGTMYLVHNHRTLATLSPIVLQPVTPPTTVVPPAVGK